MKSIEELKQQLQRLDGKDYGGYQSLKGSWVYPDFELHIDRIPKDPYAPPSTGVYRVRVLRESARFPESATATAVREVAFRDYLTRRFHSQSLRINKGRRGTGNSGVITIAEPGQEILERTSMVILDEFIEARISLGFPASGRKINGKIAEIMLLAELPEIIRTSLFAEGNHRDTVDLAHLEHHLATSEDAEFLRDSLPKQGLVAFVGNGAILPRASGIDPGPLEKSTAVPFKSPESLQVEIDLPNRGKISGMGIPSGVTLLVGGGFHGKSTLLQALELGIYNHIPGDGREYCVSAPGTAKVRASSGRSVVNTDISAFINDIPLGGATTSFSTENASGSTSQAAFIAEAIEAGAEVLLMDEDTCATNFMIRDRRMQELVAKEHEPITAFVDKVKQLYEELNISTILVMGGSGDYLGVADCVIQMTAFEPGDVTDQAHSIAERLTTERIGEGGGPFKNPRARYPTGEGIDPKNEYGHLRIRASATRNLVIGRENIDLSDLEQLVEKAQTTAIGRAIVHARQYMDGGKKMAQIAGQVLEDIKAGGLDVLDPNLCGDLAQFRTLEFAATLNRMRSLKVGQQE